MQAMMVERSEDQSFISVAIAHAKSSLEEAQKRIEGYDEQSKIPETASAFMKTAIQNALESLDDLGTTASVLKDKSIDVSTDLTETLLVKINGASAAFEHVVSLAAKYDEEHKLSTTVVGASEGALQRGATALADAFHLTASAAEAARARSISAASNATTFLLSSAAALDSQFDIESRASSAGAVAIDKAKALDERYSVKENVNALANKGLEGAQDLDLKVTGGKLAPVVLSLFDKGHNTAMTEFAKMQDGYQSAKRQQAEAAAKPAEIRSKYFHDFRAGLPSMAGKVVAVTGCTSGTGYICARVCAELGAKVLMLNRPSERADAALKNIREEVPSGTVTLVPCDLMSFASVRKAAEQLRDELGESGIDVLCNNAGIAGSSDQATVDGCDPQMQTNYLSHFLLTAEVWPLLDLAAAKRGEARVVNHSSVLRGYPYTKLDAKYLGKNGGNLGGDDIGIVPLSGPRWKRYQQSKLAAVCFTYALDDRLKQNGSKVKVLVAHPGSASTHIAVSSQGTFGVSSGLTDLLMRNVAQSAEDGTMPLLTCCCVNDVKSREFYGPKVILSGPVSKELESFESILVDAESRTMLWEESMKVTEATFPF